MLLNGKISFWRCLKILLLISYNEISFVLAEIEVFLYFQMNQKRKSQSYIKFYLRLSWHMKLQILNHLSIILKLVKRYY